MTLDDIVTLRGSAQLIATYKHIGPHQFTLQFLFKDGSGRKFTCDHTYRTKTQLMHDWLYNRHKFSQYTFTKAS